MEKKRKPEIRFRGFNEDWEQRKASNIANYSKGNGYSKNDLIEVGTPIILYGRLYTKYQFVISDVDTFAPPKNGAVYSQGNEVIIPASGETADDIARASAVEKSGAGGNCLCGGGSFQPASPVWGGRGLDSLAVCAAGFLLPAYAGDGGEFAPQPGDRRPVQAVPQLWPSAEDQGGTHPGLLCG